MRFRPLHDRVVVKRIDAEEKTTGGIIIPDSAKEKPSQGEITAVGPGGRDEAGKLIPIDLKVGDRVLFGNMASLNRLARCSGCTCNVNVPLVPNGIWRTQLSSTCGVIRPTLISGDFFVSIPEADIHILKYIIYDWNDEQSLKILLAVRRWMVTRFDQPRSARPCVCCLSSTRLCRRLPNAIELYLSSAPPDDPVRFLSRSP